MIEIGSAWVRAPQNSECPGAVQVDGYLHFHLNAHGAVDLVLKKKRYCDPKCLNSFTCLTRGVTSPHCAPPVWIANLPVCL